MGSLLFSNMLSGTIPSNVGDATDLVSLYVLILHFFIDLKLITKSRYLEKNQLTGEVPDSLSLLRHLVGLCVDLFHSCDVYIDGAYTIA
jgi:hypothetical protein